MEYIWIGLIIALAIIVFYKPVSEKMTNQALLETLSKFGKTGPQPKKVDPYEEPIYGPKTTQLVEPIPASSGGNSGNVDLNVYPDIYGPEVITTPGTKKKSKHAGKPNGKPSGKHESDQADDELYEYNPDFKNAFPFDENEPQPFLTDFSKFQH